MDLRLFGQVLWRYRLLIAAGWVLACLAAFVAFVKITPDGLSYRQSETYSAIQDLFVTERGFPEGRTSVGDPLEAQEGQLISDPGRLAALTTLYVELVTSDQVRAIMLEDGPINGYVIPLQFTDASGREGLPSLRLTAYSDSPAAAIDLAKRQTEAFQQFIQTEQERAGIAPRDRVILEVLRGAEGATLEQGRSLTQPAIVFIAIMAATIALSLLLNNLRTRGRSRRDAPTWDQLAPDDIIERGGHQVRVPDDRPDDR